MPGCGAVVVEVFTAPAVSHVSVRVISTAWTPARSESSQNRIRPLRICDPPNDHPTGIVERHGTYVADGTAWNASSRASLGRQSMLLVSSGDPFWAEHAERRTAAAIVVTSPATAGGRRRRPIARRPWFITRTRSNC